MKSASSRRALFIIFHRKMEKEKKNSTQYINASSEQWAVSRESWEGKKTKLLMLYWCHIWSKDKSIRWWLFAWCGVMETESHISISLNSENVVWPLDMTEYRFHQKSNHKRDKMKIIFSSTCAFQAVSLLHLVFSRRTE